MPTERSVIKADGPLPFLGYEHLKIIGGKTDGRIKVNQRK